MNLSTVVSPLALAAALLAPASVYAGAPGGPAGAPHLSFRSATEGHSGHRLTLVGGPAFGTAWLVVDHAPNADPGDSGAVGAALDPRTIRDRGSVLTALALDRDGGFDLPVPDASAVAGTRLSVVTMPFGGGLADAMMSNAIVPLGGVQNVSFGPTRRVVITEFMKDPTDVTDSHGEWFELFNPSPFIVDIEGWVLSDLGSDSVALFNGGLGIPILPFDYVVLARDGDFGTNGGVFVDHQYAGFSLSNSSDGIAPQLTFTIARVLRWLRS